MDFFGIPPQALFGRSVGELKPVDALRRQSMAKNEGQPHSPGATYSKA